MTPESVMTIGRTALETTILVASPVLLVTLVVGLLIAVFQAATQINDASLSFIPKVIAVLVTFAIAGPWMLTVMTDYMRRVLTGLPGIIG
ncbi:flagellar biosynthesis protein FliQ [Thiobacillus sp. 65-1402]|uniref:flagellar biosynthesis protein FliQ n=1 Tax=Thiobacillus sp. 65-1402 TaxID=1895861 RepID=UPI000959ADB7|nr:flagellar biosynthesis protein FliQ [Thiobacillus sp. 65-1402]OJW92683.1 MAG: EscS/YscS/HrcS family type III secretion system export apparatus protein [Thiobacillus sp. 65-1402]